MTVAAPSRTRLQASVREALDRAARFGRLMVTFSRGGATHERIGPIERVDVGSDGLRLAGASHASTIDPAAIASIEADRSGKMRDKHYPRLNFCDAAGNTLFSVVGFDGLERFDAAMAGSIEEPLPDTERPPRAPPPGEQQPAPALPFDALQLAQQSGQEIVIRHGTSGFHQEWRGRISALKPAMGFINIIDADFHLHLKDGSVSAWQPTQPSETGVRTYAALDESGQPTGLTISGAASAFVPPVVGEAAST